HPKWPLYQIADILTRGDVPDESQVQFLTEWMDNGDLGTTEGLITLALLTLSESTIALHSPEKTMEDSAVQHQEPIQQEEASSASHFGIWQIIKIIFFIGLAGHLLSKFMH
ncbi:J domain-containing protein, partial [Salmonella enterica]|nr:J domain-containing protein [Salmonella enterica]EMA5837924.1 J domain-containing protein [Salmonella enterica]EMA6042054.1 J domain-containing protein [Salmonella enterica]